MNAIFMLFFITILIKANDNKGDNSPNIIISVIVINIIVTRNTLPSFISNPDIHNIVFEILLLQSKVCIVGLAFIFRVDPHCVRLIINIVVK